MQALGDFPNANETPLVPCRSAIAEHPTSPEASALTLDAAPKLDKVFLGHPIKTEQLLET